MGQVRGRRPDAGQSVVPATASQNCESVIAWLLRVNRIYGQDDSLAVASRFARACSGGRAGTTASESQISRWERASLRATPGVIGRYEEILGLHDGRISAIAHTMHRESLGRLGPPALGTPWRHDDDVRDDLNRLLERALADEEMSGRDWAELSAALWSVPVLLHPAGLWRQLADRLLAELLIAEGPAWLWRCEAINRLLGLRDSTCAVIDACTAVIEDKHSQVLIEPMALLEMSPHPAAAKQLLAQIDNPSNDHAMRAAWWAVAEKAGRGHFKPDQIERLSRAAMDTLHDNGSHLSCRVAAAETIRQMLPSVTPATRRMLSQASRGDLVTGHVMRSGTTCAWATVQAVAGRLSRAALSMMHHEILRQDPVLERLIAQMLFHPQGTRRVVAAQTIAATPYRPALATAIAGELARSATMADATLATALVQAIGHLGGANEAALVWRLVLGHGLPEPVSETAAWIVGHLRAPNGAEQWSQASSRLAQEHRHPLPCHSKALMYSLGTARRQGDLAALAATPQLHYDLRAATAWWLGIPSFLQRSALR